MCKHVISENVVSSITKYHCLCYIIDVLVSSSSNSITEDDFWSFMVDLLLHLYFVYRSGF